jgi:ParB-like chromosome segregation protein Spo0J
MEIKNVKTKDLMFDPRNARKHPDDNLSALTASLKEFGQRKPIVIDTGGVVVAGNGTLQAAIAMGWKTIAAVEVPSEWSKSKIAAFALADNRTAELAQWDARQLLDTLDELDEFDMAALGFEQWNRPEDTGAADGEQVESKGLGNPIISYEIIFDSLEQQSVWFEFLKLTRIQSPNAETNAERIVTALTEYIEGN